MIYSRRALALASLAAVFAVAGCAGGTTQGRTGRTGTAQLTQSEMAESTANNLYDAIAKLRPEWLSSRGPTSVTDGTPSGVDVYMNGTLLGKAESLRDLRLSDVSAVRYWDAGQASARFGMGHPRGVIEITRK
jgi:hypothetical protein